MSLLYILYCFQLLLLLRIHRIQNKACIKWHKFSKGIYNYSITSRHFLKLFPEFPEVHFVYSFHVDLAFGTLTILVVHATSCGIVSVFHQVKNKTKKKIMCEFFDAEMHAYALYELILNEHKTNAILLSKYSFSNLKIIRIFQANLIEHVV